MYLFVCIYKLLDLDSYNHNKVSKTKTIYFIAKTTNPLITAKLFVLCIVTPKAADGLTPVFFSLKQYV